MMKLLSIALIAIGEILAIYAELYAAHQMQSKNTQQGFWISFVLMTLAGAALLGGYMIGYKSFENIWIVVAVSIGSILIVEPIVAYAMFKEIPTKGAIIGLVLGVAGTFTSMFVK
jgi:drug/metabolite transporter (DMT)-like permease